MVLLTDLSEVLVNGMAGLEHRLAERYYEKPSDKVDFADRFLRRRREVDDVFLDLMRGRLTENDYWRQFLSEGEWPMGIEEVKSAFGENMTGVIPGTLQLYQRIVWYPDMPGLPSSTLVSGAPDIYIVSDHIAERVNGLKLSHPDVFHAVADVYWSCDMDVVKTDPDFFPWVLRDLRIDPREALFVDDLMVNVAAAAHIGIPSVHFRNHLQLEQTLRDVYKFQFAAPAPECHWAGHCGLRG